MDMKSLRLVGASVLCTAYYPLKIGYSLVLLIAIHQNNLPVNIMCMSGDLQSLRPYLAT